MLVKCRVLSLGRCKKITDASVALLDSCDKLYLNDNIQLSNECIRKLHKCREVQLWRCPQLTRETINYLREKGCLVSPYN